ncbi:MAG: hypothetical protein PHF21_05135, partial [Bacilli bacterium]|nr:hypothetical protein [Bacilli bacterium]
SLTQRSSLAYRDFFIILSLPQYYFLIMSIIRGIGFDVRKFNFTKDLEELEIKSEDDEEFEFVLGTDTYKYQRKLRRIIRELKYYVLENKLVFTVIISTFLSFVFIFFILNFNFLNKVYRVGSTGTVGNLKYKLISAYETKYDYNGQIVSENKKYVILDMIITNNVNSPQTLTNISMYLKAGNNSVYNEPSLRNYFVDFGRTYITDEIQGNTTNRYLLVFELENKTNYKKYYLNILKSIDTKDGITKYNYSKFKIKPEKMISAPVSIERKVNEVMYLGENIFKNSNITFKNIEINSSYQYKYQSCNKKDCRDYYDVIAPSNSASNSLLVLNYKLELSKDIGLKEAIINDKHFFDKFLKIEYNYNNKKMIRSVNAKITSNLENMVFVEIPKTALSSDLLNLIISTRNNTYYIDLTT